MKNIIILDVETTGPDYLLDEIYQMSYIVLDKDFNIVDEASLMQYIKPDFARLTDIGPSEDTDEDAKPDKKGLVAIKSGIKPKLREIEKKAWK